MHMHTIRFYFLLTRQGMGHILNGMIIILCMLLLRATNGEVHSGIYVRVETLRDGSCFVSILLFASVLHDSS